MTDICVIKKVTIPPTWRSECPEKKGHLLKRVTECASENSDIPGAVGIKHDLPAVTNPTNVTAVREELDKLYNAASSKVVEYSMLKNQCDVQCHHGIGRVVNELIDKSANLHSFINRANRGESYQPHPTDPNLLQLISKPTTVVSIAEGDVSNLVDLCRLGTPSDRMYLCCDMDFVIDGGNDALSAIHFVDGDSGFIVTKKSAQLQKYSQYGSTVRFTTEMWISFREAFHDAVEISHQFVVSQHPSSRNPISHDLGSVAHWSAMDTLYSAKKVSIHVVDDQSIIHQSEGRLIVTIIVQRENDLALQVIRNGVSFLTEEGRKQAPSEYKDAEVFAEENGKGLYAIPKHLLGFTDDPINARGEIEMCKFTQCPKANHATKCRFADCMPWKLRDLGLDFIRKELIVCEKDQQLHVTRSKANIHQSMVFVAESTIPNAGCGLFLRPHSTEMYFNAGDTLCLYSRETLTEEQVGGLSNQDYVLDVGESRFADASVFHGWNLGRFVNQGGLLEGLKKLATDFDKKYFRPDSAEKVVERFCNVKFSRNPRNKVSIKVKDRLRCNTHNTAKELFVNYGLLDYWIKYISNIDSATMEHDSGDELSQLVRWIVATNRRSGDQLKLNHAYSDAQVDWLVSTCPSDCPVQYT